MNRGGDKYLGLRLQCNFGTIVLKQSRTIDATVVNDSPFFYILSTYLNFKRTSTVKLIRKLSSVGPKA
jgi:hypothetical protein